MKREIQRTVVGFIVAEDFLPKPLATHLDIVATGRQGLLTRLGEENEALPAVPLVEVKLPGESTRQINGQVPRQCRQTSVPQPQGGARTLRQFETAVPRRRARGNIHREIRQLAIREASRCNPSAEIERVNLARHFRIRIPDKLCRPDDVGEQGMAWTVVDTHIIGAGHQRFAHSQSHSIIRLGRMQLIAAGKVFRIGDGGDFSRGSRRSVASHNDPRKPGRARTGRVHVVPENLKFPSEDRMTVSGRRNFDTEQSPLIGIERGDHVCSAAGVQVLRALRFRDDAEGTPFGCGGTVYAGCAVPDGQGHLSGLRILYREALSAFKFGIIRGPHGEIGRDGAREIIHLLRKHRRRRAVAGAEHCVGGRLVHGNPQRGQSFRNGEAKKACLADTVFSHSFERCSGIECADVFEQHG